MSQQKYRLGYRETDYRVALGPFDRQLSHVGGLDRQGRHYAVLRHDVTGEYYARDVHAVAPRLVRAFPVSNGQ